MSIPIETVVSELTQRSVYLSSESFVFFPIFIPAGLMYLSLTSGASAIQAPENQAPVRTAARRAAP